MKITHKYRFNTVQTFCAALGAATVLNFLAINNAVAAYDMENLDRGLVAISNNQGIFISWRWLGNESESTSYNVYRDGRLITASPIHNRTNFLDTGGSATSTYTVAAIANGQEQPISKSVTPWSDIYQRIPLNRPSGGRTPDGVTYDYSPNDASVADLDGDGAYEIVVKWDPSNAQDSSKTGYTGNVYLDGYEFDGTHLWRIDLGRNIRAGAHYTQFIAYDLDSDGIAEVACRTADGTKDGKGKTIGNAYADYRNSSGYILSGPEYLTIFSGKDGAALATTDYIPARGSVSSWGDDYGNRVDRFLAGLAWLDGEHPSLIMSRGYYTRSVVAAWDWRNGKLSSRWVFDTNNGNSTYAGQGAHSLSVGDVDNDGRHEIVFGAATIDDNGWGLYSTRLGHGDALHLSDMDPNRPGLEVYMVHESPKLYGNNGSEMHDAATGRIIWGASGENADVGRGVAMDIDPRYDGYEAWASRGGLRSADGRQISSSRPSQMNFGVYWDGDLGREILDRTMIDKWNYQSNSTDRLLTAYQYGAEQNNGSKANPALSADILGDWREEVIWRDKTNDALLLFSTTIESDHKLRTLMHDPQYRAAIAWQNVGYNQPPHTSYFLGYNMATAPSPDLNLIGGNTAVTPEANLDASMNGNSVLLQWSSSNVSISHVEIYRDTDANPSGRVRIASLGATATSYSDTQAGPGTTYYYWVKFVDNNGQAFNSNAASVNTPTEGSSTLVIQENTIGFCSVDGAVESDHSGYSGSGYANTTNATGMSVEYAVHVAQSGSYALSFRYANGSNTDRSARILIDNTNAGSLSLTPTNAWNSWQNSSNINVYLSAGYHHLTVAAEVSEGLPNIDSLAIEGLSPSAASCDQQPTPLPTPEPTPLPTPEPTLEPTPEPTPQPTPEPTLEPTPQPTPEPTSTPSPSSTCSYTLSNHWGSGFVAVITMTNKGTSPINNWDVEWSYSDGSQVDAAWNVQLTGNNPYKATGVSWNSTIQPGQSIQFGIQGTGGTGSEIPELTGSACH